MNGKHAKPSSSDMELKLVEVVEPEVLIDFKPNAKCRTELHLRALHPSLPVYFKVQTSSPDMFHVNPPSGVLRPLSLSTLQIILRPQPLPPPSFPLSPSHRFLVRSALSPALLHRSSHPIPSSPSTPLRVAFAGPFLLRLAASSGDSYSARLILRRQPHLLPLIHPAPPPPAEESWSSLHAAAAAGGYNDLIRLIDDLDETEMSTGLDWRDREGRTPLHVAAARGHLRCARLLVERGADKDATSNDGRTALYRAAANGDAEMAAMLVEIGADTAVLTARGRSPLDVARDKAHQEVVDILERWELVLMASGRGDLRWLDSLLKKRVGIHGHDQYGMTALHLAAIKGRCDIMLLLIEHGMDVASVDLEGHTPLHLAVEGGCIEAVELLIGMGADINARTLRGVTPLHLANLMGHDGISRLMLSRGAVAVEPSLASASSSASSLISCI